MAIDTSTVGGAITQVARYMSMVNGKNMTPYSDETALSYIISAHEYIKECSEWDEMVIWRTRTLDGVTGKVTELITDTTDWKDIIRLYHESMQTPVARVSSYVNPLPSTSQLIWGYKGLHPNEDNTTSAGRYLIQMFPATLTGQVLLQIHQHIDFTNRDVILPVDWWWHVYRAAWEWACDDGTNPVQIQKFEKQMKEREELLMTKENSRPVLAQPNQLVPNDWWEADAPYA